MSSRLLRDTGWEELATDASYEPEQMASLCTVQTDMLDLSGAAEALTPALCAAGSKSDSSGRKDV
jgi:hypothetical protein